MVVEPDRVDFFSDVSLQHKRPFVWTIRVSGFHVNVISMRLPFVCEWSKL
jgi:hypothetical protein